VKNPHTHQQKPQKELIENLPLPEATEITTQLNNNKVNGQSKTKFDVSSLVA
jgi:hypothetical protein